MRAKTLRFGATAVVAVASWLACSLAAHAGDNSWTNSANGYWEVGGNWSAGAPSINFGWHYITNANTKTVSAYSPLPASTLTISNLTISAPGGDTNTLYIYNLSEGPLTFSNSLTLLSGGALRVGNAATVRVESVSGGNFTVDGNALITGGQLTATNGSTHVGSAGVGEMTVSNGLALLGGTIVGHFPGSHGSLTVVGGTNQVLRELAVGNAAESTGSVLVTGGQFIATNSYTYMGALGVGQMTVSNGLALLQDAYIGRYFTSHGNLTVAGGTNQVLGFLHVGEGQDSTGSVLVTGGQLIATNSWTYVGESGVGRMTVSNGVALLRSVSIGNSAGSHGSLTIAGGTNQVLGDLLVAGWPNSMGSVLVSGGQLIVSNGWTDVGSSGIGEMTVSNGLALLQDAYIGRYAGSLGSLRVAGGTNQVLGLLEVGVSANSTGSVLVGGGQLIVTNNSTYVGHDGVGRMTVSNGLAQLQHTYVGYGDGSQGSLTVAGGTNQVLGSLQVGQSAGSTGSVLVTGGQLIATNDWTYVGNNGIGQMVVSNGLAMLGDTFVGYYGGSLGSLTVAGGTNQVLGVLFVAGALNSTGSVLVSAGQLIATNSWTYVGYTGVGRMTVNNGLAFLKNAVVGYNPGSLGSLTVAGGTNQVLGALFVGGAINATGSVLVGGGQLIVTNSYTYVGNNGVGQMTISNGLARLGETYVGYAAGSLGSLTVAGGTNQIVAGLSVGYAQGANGTVTVNGGQLIATNATAYFGRAGNGDVAVNGGAMRLDSAVVGSDASGWGSLLITGGDTTVTNAGGTGSLEVRRGLLGLNGGALTVDKLIVTNSGGTVSFLAGTLNTRGSAVTNGAAFVIGDGWGEAATMNLLGGAHGFGDGLTVNYDGKLAGSGTVFADLTHYGLIVASNGTLQLNGSGSGGGGLQVRPGATLEFVGSYNLNGTVTNLGFINIADGIVQLLGTIRGAGGVVQVQPATILEIGGNVAGVITNQGALQLYSGASSFTLSGGLDNQGNFAVKEGQLVNVSGGLANSGAIVVNDSAILTASGFSNQLQAGSMFLNQGSSLQVGRAWTNAGVIQLDQSTLQGGAIANSVLIEGSGTINAALTNRAGGTVRAEGGVLRLAGAVGNQTGAFLEVRAGATLNLARGLNNYGTVNSRDGVVDFQSNTLTNYGTLSGFGTFKAGLIENRNQAHFEGGSIDVEAVYLNTNGASTIIAHSSAIFFGAVTNASSSTIKLTGGYATFMGDFYNNGLYYSDPATNTFDTLTLGPSGVLMGGVGDEFIFGGDLLNYSTNALTFDLTQAALSFTAGSHTFALAGADYGTNWVGYNANFAIGEFAITPGGGVTFEDGNPLNGGAALYVDVFNASAPQVTSPFNIYYNPASNPSLSNQTLALTGGGWLIPVPEPATWMLLLAGAGALVLRRKRAQP